MKVHIYSKHVLESVPVTTVNITLQNSSIYLKINMTPFHYLFLAMNCVKGLYRERTRNMNVKYGHLKQFQPLRLPIYVLQGIIIFTYNAKRQK